MFEIMLGVPKMAALIITSVVLLIYVVLGGAHADILTDGVQGFIMVGVGVLVAVLFCLGYGIEGGFDGMISALGSQDENLVGWLNVTDVLYHSWWAVFAVFLARAAGHAASYWQQALGSEKPTQRMQFIRLAFVFADSRDARFCGIMARVILGGIDSNQALALLFIDLFPSWFAALLGVEYLPL